LHAVMNEIKIADCESDTTKYDQAWTV
jgi:hypothetical protein